MCIRHRKQRTEFRSTFLVIEPQRSRRMYCTDLTVHLKLWCLKIHARIGMQNSLLENIKPFSMNRMRQLQLHTYQDGSEFLGIKNLANKVIKIHEFVAKKLNCVTRRICILRYLTRRNVALHFYCFILLISRSYKPNGTVILILQLFVTR